MRRDPTSPLGGWQSSICTLSPEQIEDYRRRAFHAGFFDIRLDDCRLAESERQVLITIGQRIWGR